MNIVTKILLQINMSSEIFMTCQALKNIEWYIKKKNRS